MNSAERKLLNNLPEQLSKLLELAKTQALGQHVSKWIENGQCNDLVDYLCTAIYEKRIEKLSRFGNNLKKLGVNLVADNDTKLNENDSGCKWVPSTFSQLDGRRAYGGVFLQPKLKLQNDKGFQGFQASTKNAASTANVSRGNSSGSSGGGSPSGGGSSSSSGRASSSGGGSSGSSGRDSSPLPKTKKQFIEKYGNGKGWPKTPIRLRESDTYGGKPGTGKLFNQC